MAELAHATLIPSSSFVSNQLDRNATRVMARARLRSELRSIVLDILGPCEPGELPEALAGWLEDAADVAVSAVCDASLRGLLESVAASVAEAPPSVVARLAQEGIRHDAGVD